ncbi:hypothetical protein [Variovorax sp. GrIS 2.14]|uniref:hypothetical protein n=1 Tax=Variovorax sp. GrIS 2.14 TaxID=3071709 RepID=UPI0038F7EC9C
MGTIFTFVAAAGFEAAAPALVTFALEGAMVAFNGFLAAGWLADTAGFFELGIQPRTSRINKRNHTRTTDPVQAYKGAQRK